MMSNHGLSSSLSVQCMSIYRSCVHAPYHGLHIHTHRHINVHTPCHGTYTHTASLTTHRSCCIQYAFDTYCTANSHQFNLQSIKFRVSNPISAYVIHHVHMNGEPIVSHSKPGMSQRRYINSYEFKIPRVRKKQSDMTCYCIITLWAQVHFGLRQVALIGSSLHTEARSTLGCQARHCHPCPPRNRYLTVYSC